MTVRGVEERRSAVHWTRAKGRAANGGSKPRTLGEEVQEDDGEDKDDGEGEHDDGIAVFVTRRTLRVRLRGSERDEPFEALQDGKGERVVQQ